MKQEIQIMKHPKKELISKPATRSLFINTQNTGNTGTLQEKLLSGIYSTDWQHEISSWSKGKIRLFNYLLWKRAYHLRNITSHRIIARAVKLSTRQVKRLLVELRDIGLILWHGPTKLSRYNREACQYFIHPIVDDRTFRNRHAKWFENLRLISITLLTSLAVYGNAVQNENVLPFSLKVLRETKQNIHNISNCISKRGLRTVTKKQIQYPTKKGASMDVQLLKQKANVITALQLSEAGIISISPYHIEALEEANRSILKAKGEMRNAIGYIIRVAESWHKKSNIEPEYEYRDGLLAQLPMLRSQSPYKDDGKVHRSVGVIRSGNSVAHEKSVSVLGLNKPEGDLKGDTEAQPQYKTNGQRQSYQGLRSFSEVGGGSHQRVGSSQSFGKSASATTVTVTAPVKTVVNRTSPYSVNHIFQIPPARDITSLDQHLADMNAETARQRAAGQQPNEFLKILARESEFRPDSPRHSSIEATAGVKPAPSQLDLDFKTPAQLLPALLKQSQPSSV